MINEINNLKKEIKILKNEIEELKNYNNLIKEKLSMKKTSENKEKNLNNAYNNKPIFNIEKNSFSLDFNPTLSPKNIKFFNNLVYGSNGTYMSFNNYIVFKANNDITYLIYAYHLSIISFNMNDNKKQNEIKKAHDKTISSFRYYNDKLNKQDLFISVSCEDYNIKLWNFNKMELIVNIEKIYSNCFHKALLKSVAF